MSGSSGESSRATTVFGARLGRHAGVYGLGSMGVVTFGLVTVAVLTRVLDLRSYGELAVLYFFAALLTVLFNLGTLQGSFASVFGNTGEEDGTESEGGPVVRDRRRALGTGLAITSCLALAGTAAAVAFAGSIAEVLLPGADAETAVVWAASCGGLGAIWRFISQTLRFERRPIAYVVLSFARPILALGSIIPLVLAGYGVEGALAGTAIGTAAANAVALSVTRRNYAFAMDRGDARVILRRGRAVVPIVVAFWLIQNADLYFVSRVSSTEDAALYRVASRIAGVLSYASSAFFMAWGPLRRTSAFAAVDQEKGKLTVGAEMITYFLLASTLMLLVLAAGAGLLIRIAPSSYAAAAPVIPALGLGVVAHGLFTAMYRGARIRRKRLKYVGMAAVAVGVFILITPPLIERFGLYGGAAGQSVSFLVGFLGILFLSQRGPNPLAFDYRRIGGMLLLAAACFAGIVAAAAARLPALLEVFAVLALLVSFPLLAWATGIVPWAHARQIGAIGRSLLAGRELSRRDIASRVGGLGARQSNALELLARDRASPALIGEVLGEPEEAVLERFVQDLRALASDGASSAQDAEIGAHLLSRAATAERDANARRLLAEGVDPLELHTLAATLQGLRQLPPETWQRPAD